MPQLDSFVFSSVFNSFIIFFLGFFIFCGYFFPWSVFYIKLNSGRFSYHYVYVLNSSVKSIDFFIVCFISFTLNNVLSIMYIIHNAQKLRFWIESQEQLV